ncbi:PadR family transcriptional regulator [Parvibaculum sp.]|uniref:PadR family transcriptional regulator n=1 Tax=Parvibaculum sp. TaxID=2024848 RepID=UPI002BF32379|nr:PadR family transcriptional regulator [Parvibaculum sp.]HUD51752.1 PadR family transcriptional regulator [Parvibaculum sp.]
MNTKELLLSVLMSGPATGYDIKKVLENEVSNLVDVTISNIYPVLNELAAEGLVDCERVEQENRPNKKVYAITEAGRSVCLRALMSEPARHKLRSEFMFILSFVPYLPKARIRELLDQRIAEIEETQASLDVLDEKSVDSRRPSPPGQLFCIGMGRAMLEAERSFIDQNRDWLLKVAPDEAAMKELTTI